ncbi:sigma-70 family RNA polymerase sigma factor [Prolixibacteraceae bacterium JC049]|nr:sigma-70 family RNA polymerase sigma factor [Prolixibacteraceae bacterium JC049]
MGKKACCDPHQVVTDFYDKILSYVNKRVSSEHNAQDITQEVMGRMIDAYNKEVPVQNVKSWLYQVTRNVIADRFRKTHEMELVNDEMDEEASDFFPELTAEDFIIPMIRLLPEEYATPLYLSDIERLKQADIAKKLNISLSAAKMRCQRGRKKLHELFLECCNIHYTEKGAFDFCTLKTSCTALLHEKDRMKQSRMNKKA